MTWCSKTLRIFSRCRVRGCSTAAGIRSRRVGDMTPDVDREVNALQREWSTNGRWTGVKRDHSDDDVVRLRGSVRIEHTLARRGSQRLWDQLNASEPTRTFGAMTG